MKPPQKLFPGLTVLLLFTTLQGCLDIVTTTVVNRDGSMNRSVMIEGDSAAIHERRFPFALKGSWHESIEQIDSRKYRYTVMQDFPDAAALNEAMTGETGRSLNIRVSLEERFEWFFTVYRYSEHHASFNSFDTPPLTEYLTQSQIDLLLNKESKDEDSENPARDQAEKKIEEWWTRSVFEAFFTEFLAGVKTLNAPALNADAVLARKDELFRTSREELSNHTMENIQGVFEKAFGRNLVREAIAANPEGFRDFQQRLAFQQQMFENSYRATAEMPGTIISTNAAIIEGNSVTWEDFITHGLIAEYELWVESREMNWWMIYLTGIGVIFVFLLLIIPLFWKRGIVIPKKITA